MGLIYPGVHKPVVQQILRHFPVENFVETGTYTGDTAFWASTCFKNVFTIERSMPIWEETQNRYRHVENIKFLFGDSADVIREITPQINGSAIFWLDAHWSGGLTYGDGDECALLRELEAVFEIKQDNFILIDDARLFLLPPPRPHVAAQWPDLGQIMRVIEKNTGHYTVVMDDVVIVCPKSSKPVLLEFYQDYSTRQWEKSQVKPSETNLVMQYMNRLISGKQIGNKKN